MQDMRLKMRFKKVKFIQFYIVSLNQAKPGDCKLRGKNNAPL